MNTDRRSFLAAAAGASSASRLKAQELVYQCPMDPDVRSNVEGVCPRCGMKLRSGIPEPIEFPMDLKLTPSAPKVGEKVQLEFSVLDPENSKLIQHFQIVHEKLFHMFVISQDLQFFVHDHPGLRCRMESFAMTSSFPNLACIASWATSIPMEPRLN